MSWLRYTGLLSAFSAPEAGAPDFRRELEEMLHRRLKVLGALLLTTTSLYSILKMGVLGASVQWSLTTPLPVGRISFLETVASVLCGSLDVAGAYLGATLVWGRLIGALNPILVGGAILYTDALRGAFSPGYVVLGYATIVALLPYRAGQTLSIGTVLTLLVMGAGWGLRPALGLDPAQMQAGSQALQVGLMTILMTGISGVLHRNRYRLFRARRETEEARREEEKAREEAEKARRRAERQAERLAELDEAKNRFFANVSHELRTPLTTILGPLEDALEGRYGDLPDRFQDRLDAMKRQAERLRALVDDLLRLSKLEEGQMELAARPIDLGPFLERMASLFDSMAERQGAAVQVETGGSPRACADPEALKQIVSNLLSNALEHTPEGGAVRLRAETAESHPGEEGGAEGERAVISVRDAGPGLPEEVQGRLFERYVGAQAGEQEGPGVSTGIGLAVVKELAERHGGAVEAESEESVGTEITVALPAGPEALPEEDLAGETQGNGRAGEEGAEDRVVPEPTVEEGRLAPPPTEERAGPWAGAEEGGIPGDGEAAPEGRPTVLVVDDEAEVRRYLKEVLAPRYAAEAAADGEEGLEKARETRPDLVISDVVMPRRDGYELCRALRADERLRALPIILLTVQDEQEDRMAGLREGADAYLAKPFRPEELRQRVENLIGIRRYLQSQGEEESAPGGLSETSEGSAQARVGTESEVLRAVRSAVERHLESSAFGVERLADEVGLSTRQLQRRLQEETGLTAAAFIRALRMERAAELLRNGTATTVKEAASAVGYRNPSYFSRLFKEAHGAPPSELKAGN